jgi:hypothetical protein
MSDILQLVKNKDPQEREFHQAVEEFLESIEPVLERNPEYGQAKILERLVEPERVIMFRVPWLDDQWTGSDQQRFSSRDEQRDRSLQRWTSVSSFGKPGHFKISGF